MRKLILVTAVVLASASAQAAGTRGLTLASADGPVAAQPPAPQVTEAARAAEAAKFVERPAAVTVTPGATATTAAPPAPSAEAATIPRTIVKTEKPRHKRYWTEGRIVGELHRHGIYW
jgi:hypothetical protein